MIRLVAFLLLISLWSCDEKVNLPDVSGIKINYGLYRIEEPVFYTESRDSLTMILQGMYKNHPEFYGLYFQHIFPVGPVMAFDSLADAILTFKKQPLSDSILHKVRTTFQGFDKIQGNFDKAFTYARYYFPDKPTPDVYTFISEFGFQGFIFEGKGGKDALGVGLDMFLANSLDYKRVEPDNPGFSSYITRSWNPDHLVRKSLEVWISDFVEPTQGNRLLDQMVYNGKKLYILKQLLPEVSDTILFEYSEAAMDWCASNEKQMWSFFIEKNLINDSNPIQIGKYINPSPDSPGMPREAPGRTGNYLGYLIVKAYMEKKQGLSLEALAMETDADKIYKESNYKPRR